jgi:hypothetical protein
VQDDPFHSRDDLPQRPSRVKQQAKSSNRTLAAAAIAITSLLGILAAVLLRMAPQTPSAPIAARPDANQINPIEKPQPEPSHVVLEEIVDDPAGTLLWASPTAGPPISLAYVPSGTQCLVYFQVAKFVAHAERPKVYAALGPWGREQASRLVNLTATHLGAVDSVLLAISAGSDGSLDAAARLDLLKPWNPNDWIGAKQGGRQASHGEHRYWLAHHRAYLTPSPPPEHPGVASRVVVCPPDWAPELLDAALESPPLVRDLERLAARTDVHRIATIVFAPKFFHASGSKLLTGTAAPLRDALSWLLGNDATAVAVSLHWDDNFFVELRATPALNVPPQRLAAKLRDRISQAPSAVEKMILESPQHSYSREVLTRFPAMLRELARYTRSGEEDKLAVVRCYLPATAGHNLLMASELMLAQPLLAPSSGEAPTVPAKEQGLGRVTSLSFAKESLERAVELLADDIKVPIVIQGADLQLDGITKNQTLDLDLRDQPARQILLQILLRANPDRTATGPSDPRQKLVYVTETAEDGALRRIIVTTRTASEKRGDALPDEFVGRNR